MKAITPDLLIGDVVARHPEVIPVFSKPGVHCVGCHVSPYETLEQGSMGHGMPEDVFNKMMEEANSVVGSEEADENEASDDVKEMSVEFTEKAISKVKELMKTETKANSLRIRIVPGGCSGSSYQFAFESKTNGSDLIKEFKGLNVVMDRETAKQMEGAKVDFLDTLHGSGFKVDNPNSSGTCGCGSSFH